MAGKEERKFIENLQNFSEALEGVVEALKEQSKSRETDALNVLLKNIDAEKIKELIVDVKEIKEDTKSINKKIDKLLQAQQSSAASAKDQGLFAKVGSPENKNQIMDGVKIIGAISIGVLAIGMAFKLIGTVDYKSVLALSAGIAVMSLTFAEVLKLEGLSFGKVLLAGFMMVAMSASVLGAALILKNIPVISMAQGITSILVSGAMGMMIYAVLKGLSGVKMTTSGIIAIALLPFIIPFLARSVVTASQILSGVKTLGLGQMITSVFVSGVLGIMIYSVLKGLSGAKLTAAGIIAIALLPLIIPYLAKSVVSASQILSGVRTITLGQMITSIFVAAAMGVMIYATLQGLKGVDLSMKTLIAVALLPLIVPILAGALVAASWVLQFMKPVGLGIMFSVISTSLAVGISVVVLGAAFWVLAKLGKDNIIKGAQGAIIIVATLMASSLILSLGQYSIYPSWQWSLQVGLSLVIFGTAMYVLSKLGAKPADMLKAGLAVLIISATIMLSSWILSIGKYDKFPSLDWAKGVGLSMLAFGTIMLVMGYLLLSPTSWIALAFGIIAVGVLALTIVGISWLLRLGNYKEGGYPDTKWIGGVGKTFMMFGLTAMGLALVAPFMVVGLALMLATAGVIFLVDKLFTIGSYKTYPSEKWIQGVGLTMKSFSTVMLGVNKIGLVLGLLLLPLVAASIFVIDRILSLGKYSKYPNKEWATGIQLIMSLFSKGDFGMIRDNMRNFVKGLRAFEDIDDKVVSAIDNLSRALQNLSNSMNNLDVNKLNALNNLSNAFLVISVIDQEQLEKTLSIIDRKAASIKKIIDMSTTAGRLEANNRAIGTLPGGTTAATPNVLVVRDIDKILTHIVSMDANINKMANTPTPNPAKSEEPLPKGTNVNKQ